MVDIGGGISIPHQNGRVRYQCIHQNGRVRYQWFGRYRFSMFRQSPLPLLDPVTLRYYSTT